MSSISPGVRGRCAVVFCGVWNYRHFAENRTFLLRVYSDSILRVCFGSIGRLGFLGLQAVLQCRFNILNMFSLDILTDLRHGVEDFVYTVDLLCSQRLMVLCYTGHAPQQVGMCDNSMLPSSQMDGFETASHAEYDNRVYRQFVRFINLMTQPAKVQVVLHDRVQKVVLAGPGFF